MAIAIGKTGDRLPLLRRCNHDGTRTLDPRVIEQLHIAPPPVIKTCDGHSNAVTPLVA